MLDTKARSFRARMTLATLLGLGMAIGALSQLPLRQAGAAQASDVPARATASAQKGIAFLKDTQQEDGSWQRYPGITAIAVLGMLRNGLTERDPAVAKAIQYLVAQAKPDGGIYTDAFGPAQRLPNYNTSLSVLALDATGNRRYRPIIEKAQEFLVRGQYDERDGFTRRDTQYGGIGYGSNEDNPDLSNLQSALEALKETDYPANAEVWSKALIFIQRCQNRNESNDQAWAGVDGGFIYAASGDTRTTDPQATARKASYGSMTYAGLKSYLYCSVKKDDPRVRAAYNWIRGHYSVTDNPAMGDDGLYYYYHTMAKTLSVYGEKVLVDSGGRRHEWARELANALVSQQRPDGSWLNGNPRWRENDPHLVTGYVLISLSHCRPYF